MFKKEGERIGEKRGQEGNLDEGVMKRHMETYSLVAKLRKQGKGGTLQVWQRLLLHRGWRENVFKINVSILHPLPPLLPVPTP